MTELSLGLDGVRARRVSDVLADRLRVAILSGDLPEGSRLPSVNQVMVDANVGRSSVREAMKVLESQGLIEMRAGRNGGPRVRRTDSTAVMDAIQVFIQGRQLRFQVLLDTREAIEPACAGWAAQRADDSDLDAIRNAEAAMRTTMDVAREFTRHNVEWHLAVVGAAHNELMLALMTSISGAMGEGMNPEGGFSNEKIRKAAMRAHAQVTTRICDRDADGARLAMSKHLHAYAGEVSANAYPNLLALQPEAPAPN